MESSANPSPLPPTLPPEEPTPDTPIMRLPPREVSPASEVCHLHLPDAVEGDGDETSDVLRSNHAVEGVLIRVQSHGGCRLVGPRCLLPHRKEDLPRNDGQGPEPPGRIPEEGSVPLRHRKIQLHSLRSADRNAEASRLPVEPVRLVLCLQHQPTHERSGRPLPLSSFAVDRPSALRV